MALEEFHAQPLQAIGGGRRLEIGTGNAEAEVDQHLGDAGHSDAADTDKMDVLNSAKHLPRLWSLDLGLRSLYFVLCILCFLCLFVAQLLDQVHNAYGRVTMS